MKIYLLFFCFLLSYLNMSAQNRVVQKSATTTKKISPNTEKKDYMNFDSKGEYLVSFRHTCEDGSYMEVEGTHYDNNSYFYRPVTICDTEGNKYTGTFYIGPTSTDNGIYNLNDCCKQKSYDNYMCKLFYRNLRSYGDDDESFIETKDKQTRYYYSSTDAGRVRTVLIKQNEDSYILYDCKQEAACDVKLIQISRRYTVYKNGSILLRHIPFSDEYDTEIMYDNGDIYKGKIDMKNMPINSDFFKPGIEMPQFVIRDGVMKLKDGTIRVYVKGEIDEFESKKPSYQNLFNDKERAEKAAKDLETKKKQVAQKRAGYTNKYGASSTNYLSKQSKIVKGMTLAFIREYINDFNQIGFYFPNYYGKETRRTLSLQEYKPTVRDMTQFGRTVESYKLIIGDNVQIWSFLVLNGKVVSSSLLNTYDISMNRVIVVTE